MSKLLPMVLLLAAALAACGEDSSDAGGDGSGDDDAATRYTPGPDYDRRYCEVLAIYLEGGAIRAEVWNSLPFGDCPQDQWEELDAGALQSELGALQVRLNGPRYWVLDELAATDALPDSDPRTFGEIQMALVASIMLDASAMEGAYLERTIGRSTAYTFYEGATVYELVSADATYVMQAYAQIVDETLTVDDLEGLGDVLTPPEGWTFRSRVLDQELVLAADGEATVVQDELQNTYQRVD